MTSEKRLSAVEFFKCIFWALLARQAECDLVLVIFEKRQTSLMRYLQNTSDADE